MTKLDGTPRRGGLLHLTGRRSEDGRLRCVRCEAVMPERSQGISQEAVVAVSDAVDRGRARFHVELRDELAAEACLAFGPHVYWRCDATSQQLEPLPSTA